jgi:hypothetical protein
MEEWITNRRSFNHSADIAVIQDQAFFANGSPGGFSELLNAFEK